MGKTAMLQSFMTENNQFSKNYNMVSSSLGIGGYIYSQITIETKMMMHYKYKVSVIYVPADPWDRYCDQADQSARHSSQCGDVPIRLLWQRVLQRPRQEDGGWMRERERERVRERERESSL